MSCLSDFLSKLVLAVHHAWRPSPWAVVPSMAQVTLSSGKFPFVRVLASSSFYRALTNNHTYQVLVGKLFEVFMASSLLLSFICSSECLSRGHDVCFPWESTHFFLLLGCKDGGCWLVLHPLLVEHMVIN
jgi:hypothetical protein